MDHGRRLGASATPLALRRTTELLRWEEIVAEVDQDGQGEQVASAITPEGVLLTFDGVTNSLAEFLASGGVCQSGFFPAGPPTGAALAEIQAYCAQFLVPDTSGYQRPAPDANGYVGPSKEYYSYDGYVAPGFEYQVGSSCFDPALSRCKSSGEIQLEYLKEQGLLGD